ncbi:MAG: glycosyltransferase [Desulfobacter sp.]|nr:MAG: glycosyltransferase [Desulfobacter sp.]
MIPEAKLLRQKKIQGRSPMDRAVAEALEDLKVQGFEPDLILGAAGQGSTLFVKDVFPKALFLAFFDRYPRPDLLETNREKNHLPRLTTRIKIREQTLPLLSDLHLCDHGICPTLWDKNQFPKIFQHKLQVIHPGIPPLCSKPAPKKSLMLSRLDLGCAKEIITYTNKGLDPDQGIVRFIKSIPLILEKRPDAHVVILKDEPAGYGPGPGQNHFYKKTMARTRFPDPERVHFLDFLPFDTYCDLLRASSIHVDLSRPFILSDSFLQAMSCGSIVVAPDTAQVRDIIKDGVNGILTDVFDIQKIAQKITACLDYPSFMGTLKLKAQQTIADNFCIDKTLAAQIRVVKQMIQAKNKPGPRFG